MIKAYHPGLDVYKKNEIIHCIRICRFTISTSDVKSHFAEFYRQHQQMDKRAVDAARITR